MSSFVHLHNHTEYSLLDGMLRVTKNGKGPSDFLKSINKTEMPAMAITDHGNMYGVPEFYKMLSSLEVKPIIGCEMYFTGSKYTDHSKASGPTYHLTVLAKDKVGYNNLMKLNSAAWTEGFYYHPRIDFDLLKEMGFENTDDVVGVETDEETGLTFVSYEPNTNFNDDLNFQPDDYDTGDFGTNEAEGF